MVQRIVSGDSFHFPHSRSEVYLENNNGLLFKDLGKRENGRAPEHVAPLLDKEVGTRI